MRRVCLALGALVILGALRGAPSSALACSYDGDPLRHADVILEGRITGWEVIEDATEWDGDPAAVPINDPNYYGPYTAVRLQMDVARTYKGDAPQTLTMVSGNTAMSMGNDGIIWVGSSGACGAFDADPTGRWAVLGLYEDDFGRYYPALGYTVFIGDEPSGERYERGMERLSSQLRPELPWYIFAAGALLIPLAMLLAPSLLVRRSRA